MGMTPDDTSPTTNDAPAEAPARETLTLKELAQAVLDRKLRPRTGEILRLAEAVLARPKKAKKKAKKSGAAKDAKKADSKVAGGKKRKQATIPGQAN